jgi:lipopolysaccharide transport system permease protein
MIAVIKEVYKYREFLKNSIYKDLKTRYKGSFFGFLWTFLNPFLMLVVYSVLFSIIVRMPVDNYPIFLFSTLLAWNFFQSVVQSNSSSIVSSGNLIKKIYFPHEIIPLSVVFGGLINYVYSFIILIPALVFFGYYPNLNYLWLPLVILIQTLLVLGVSLLVSSLNVFFRDLEHILTIFLNALFYLTPVLYPMSIIPNEYHWLFLWNPLSVLVNAYRDIFYYNQTPDMNSLYIVGVLSVFLLFISQRVFEKLKYSFIDEV